MQKIINFLPNLRPELRNYLVSLRAWADHMKDTKAATNNITNDETMAKVKVLYCRNLTLTVTEESLRELFER